MTTPEITGLCERLRRLRSLPSNPLARSGFGQMVNPDGTEAADTLERQAAEIAALRDELVEARTLDKGFYEWMIERDLLARGEEVEWGDIVVALTEHEIELTKADERQAAEIERLQTLLNGRDDFIVGEGLWPKFCDGLPPRAAITGEDT